MTQNTHAVTTPNKKPVTKIESLELVLAGKPLRQVTNYYNGNTHEGRKFMTSAVQYIRKVPKLLECDKTSLVTALLQSAQFRFMPSGVSGEGYIIPYGKEAKFQLGYQGIVTLLYRTDRVVGITSNIIYKNDVFEYTEGLEATLIHKPAMFGKQKGEPIGVYTIAQMKGGSKTFKVMDKDAIMGIKELSKAKKSPDSPWNSEKDPEMWMWKKTCLIQHAKLLPKTEEIQRALELDFEGEGMGRATLDPAGPATGKAMHVNNKPVEDLEDLNDDFVPPTDADLADEIQMD